MTSIKENLGQMVFFAFLVFLLYQAGRLLAPFFGPLLSALVAAIVCYPMHLWIGRKLKKAGPSLQAFLSSLLVMLFIVVPLTVVLFSAVSELQAVLPSVKAQLASWGQHLSQLKTQPPAWMARLPSSVVERLQGVLDHPDERITALASQLVGGFAEGAAGLAKDLFTLVANWVLFQFSLFFIFRDGEMLYQQWIACLPFPDSFVKRLHNRFEDIVQGMVRGTLLVGLAQAMFMTIAYVSVGSPAVVALCGLTAIASFVPAVGIGLVWLPVGLVYILTAHAGKGVVILVFGVIASFLDNVLRPLLAGNKVQLPFFWFTFALLGGLQVFGIAGLLLGPLIFAILPILLDIYRTYVLKSRD